MKTFCYTASAGVDYWTPEYPSGASTFSLVNTFSWLTINAGTGELEIDLELLAVGVYVVLVRYNLTEGGTAQSEFKFAVIDCAEQFQQNSFTVCQNTESYSFQLLQPNGEVYNDYALVAPLTGVSINSTGLLTIDSDNIAAGATSATVSFNGGDTFEVFFYSIACAGISTAAFTECERDSTCIVWVNQEGGRQSYYFNQVKEFKVTQTGSKQWVNSSKEKRSFTKGTVEDAVVVNQEFLPEAHLLAMTSLKNSIQAWVASNISDEATYKSIYLEEDSWTVRKSNSRFFSVSFMFKYSIARLIQKQ